MTVSSTTNRIKILPDAVQKKIAAGEVVEGPFSVVKELVENAVDANATAIDVQVYDSGLKKMVIRDNGDGIHSDDIELTIMEHATSKITDVYDIEKIGSYGFRGEALSSISSISELTILTRSRDEDIGARLHCSGQEVGIGEYAGASGTTMIVENLFYNIPARKKFLKAKRTELRYIREILLKIALVTPHIAYTFEVDGKRHITLPVTKNPDERVSQIYGKNILDSLYFDKLQDLKVSISGFFSKPGFLKSSRSMQLLYINNRPVENKYLGFILSRAYEAVAMKGKYPAALIFIEMDPTLVDVNIHPAKREVKLFDQRYVDSLIMSLAEKILNRQHQVVSPVTNEKPGAEEDITIEEQTLPLSFAKTRSSKVIHRIPVQGRGEARTFTNGVSELYQNIDRGGSQSINYTVNESTEVDQLQPVNSMESIEQVEPVNQAEQIEQIEQIELPGKEGELEGDIKILGTVFDTYIIAESGEMIYYIDFHAAHERFIFDSLTRTEYTFEKQELIFPAVMELSIEDYQTILENREQFADLGFEIDDFSDNTITIRAVPVMAKNTNAEDIIREFTESLKDEQENNFDIRKNIAASVACHAARRSGEQLGFDEMHRIVEQVFSGKYELRCPHGRPYIYTMSKNDLGRMFKRI
ncbi:MAG: DNA mismatch repair endonuclease MutL [bacterium]|nr:DNA mismatch repair endonuclease MutL [bacterium]